MHVTVSACFLIRFALQCRFYLYFLTALVRLRNIMHQHMRRCGKIKKKLADFLKKKNGKSIENIFVNVELKL